MFKRSLLGIAIGLNCCLLSFAAAAPTIDKVHSRGVYLIKMNSGMKIAVYIRVNHDQDFNPADYAMTTTVPGENKQIPMHFEGKQTSEKNDSFFVSETIPVEEIKKDGNMVGDYTTILADKNGKILDTYKEFLVPFRDEEFNGMGDFKKEEIIPKDGGTVKKGALVFQWSSINGAVIYEFRISKGETFDPFNLVYKTTTKENQLRLTDIKLEPGKYSWRLTAFHEDGFSKKNAVRLTLENDRLPTFTLK